jgi:predicted transcriptional regulator
MDLDKYFEESGVKRKHFLKKSGLTGKTLFDISRGSDVRLSTAFKIYKATDKKVTPYDLFDLLEKNKNKEKENKKERTEKKDVDQ